MTAQKDATLPKPLWMRSWNALPGATKGLYCRPCAPVGSPPPNYLLYLSSNVLQLASEPAVLSPLSALGITTLIPTTPAFFGPFDLLAADFHSFAKALTQQSPNTRLFVLGIGDLANHALMAACVCQHLAAAICIEPDLSLSQSHQGGPIHPTDLLPGQRCPIQIHCTEPTTLQDSHPYELLRRRAKMADAHPIQFFRYALSEVPILEDTKGSQTVIAPNAWHRISMLLTHLVPKPQKIDPIS